MTASIIFTFLKSKVGKASIIIILTALIIVAFATTIAIKDSAIRKKEEQILKQSEEIDNLNLSKESLENELNYIKSNKILENIYTNSSESIEKIEREKLTRFDNEAINKISNDFYNFYIDSGLSNYNKISENADVDSARKISYSANIRQKRFNKSLSAVCYENIAVASLV